MVWCLSPIGWRTHTGKISNACICLLGFRQEHRQLKLDILIAALHGIQSSPSCAHATFHSGGLNPPKVYLRITADAVLSATSIEQLCTSRYLDWVLDQNVILEIKELFMPTEWSFLSILANFQQRSSLSPSLFYTNSGEGLTCRDSILCDISSISGQKLLTCC